MAEHEIGSKLQRDEALASKLAKMVGKTGRRSSRRMIPGFAIAFNSVSNRRDTNALGKRAVAFYGGTQAPMTARPTPAPPTPLNGFVRPWT